MSRRLALGVCYHEAGHAVAAVALGLRLRAIEVWKDGPECLWRPDTRCTEGRAVVPWERGAAQRRVAWRRRYAIMLLAGHAAHDMHRPVDLRRDVGSWSDMRWVARLLRLRYVRGQTRTRHVRVMVAGLRAPRREARALLRLNWPAVRAVARALQRRGRLMGREVREIMKGRGGGV